MSHLRSRAFTIIELLVVVAIITLLVGILLPAVTKARDQSKLSLSISNLRQLAAAHQMYGTDYGGRQFSLIEGNISHYGSNVISAMTAYEQQNGYEHPTIILGWGKRFSSGVYTLWYLGSAGYSAYQPITFVSSSGTGGEYFGSFRLINVQAFHNYLGDRFYHPVYYAPKDIMVTATIRKALESPEEYYLKEGLNQRIAWSSYCMSPAAMFNPEVMRNPDLGGWQDPWLLPAGFKSPAYSQAAFPSLKTHMLEHHWLQSRRAECNPAFIGGTYENCEPYYFNHGWESTPVTLFYDAHVETADVRKAERADLRQQSLVGYGLWSRDTGLGEEGYFTDIGYDQAYASYHILTTDGIRGRDFIAD